MGDSWKSELTPDMLGDTIQCAIAEEIGVENLLKLSRIVGGDYFYMPIESGLLRQLRNKKIVEEYNGYNIREIAKKYDISRRMVYKILSQNAEDKTTHIQKEEEHK